MGRVLTQGNPDKSNPKVLGNGIIYVIYVVKRGDSVYEIQKNTGAKDLLINGKTDYKDTMIHPGDVILCLKN